MVPLPVAAHFNALNAKLLDGCIKRQQARLRGQTETIAKRMKRDTAALMALPAVAFDAYHKISTRVSSLSLPSTTLARASVCGVVLDGKRWLLKPSNSGCSLH